MPNTKVKFRHALIAGILAGSAYQFFQYIYIGGQLSVARYNAIYGSFAALPLFLLWVHISWTICLFGAEFTYASQNLRNFSFDKDTRNISRRRSVSRLPGAVPPPAELHSERSPEQYRS